MLAVTRYRSVVLGAAIVASALACGKPLFNAPAPRPPVIPQEPYFAPPASAAEITRIDWGRGACLGSCPIYSASLSSTGDAHWNGAFPEKYAGQDSSSIDAESFRLLAQRILVSGFFEWDELQSARATDMPSLTIDVHLADGRTKRVTGDGSLHQGIGMVIDSTAETLTWHRADRPFDYYYQASVYLSERRAMTGRSDP